MLDSKAIGNKINKLRTDSKLSQDEMAGKLFVTRQAVSKWELGQSLPSIDSLLEMSKMFSVSFEELLCLEDKEEIDPSDLFNGHSREYIVSSIIKNKIDVKLEDVFYQFSNQERMIILSAIKEKKTRANISELLPKLTSGEKMFLVGSERVITNYGK